MAPIVVPAASPERSSVACSGDRADIFASNCARVQQWRRDKLAAQRADVQRALHELQRDRTAVSSLRDTLAITEELGEGASDLQASSTRVAQVVRDAAEAAAARAGAASEVRDKLLRDRQAKSEAIVVAEEKLAKKRQSAEELNCDVEGLFALFKDNLGLSVTRAAPSVVQVELSLVDPADPDRKCSFMLGMADPVTYCVSDCNPPLPASVVNAFVARLNEANMEPWALPAFVCSLRKRFRAVLAAKRVASGGA